MPTCFVCSAPATETAVVPAEGWGAAYAKVRRFEAPACAEHGPAPGQEPELVALALATGPRKAAKPAAEHLPALRSWMERLARACFAEVFDKPWAMPLQIVSPRLGVAEEARDLADELQAELKEPLQELFPEPGPHTKLDYFFFESDSERDEDAVLWIRLPGGLVGYAWPGEL